MPNDEQRLMAVKQALVATTATAGWSYIRQMAENVVARAINEALDEEDSTRRDAKTLKASALRKGFADLFNAIEVTKQLEPTPNDTDWTFELDAPPPVGSGAN